MKRPRWTDTLTLCLCVLFATAATAALAAGPQVTVTLLRWPYT